MDFSFSEEQTLLRNTIQSFIQDNYDFDKRQAIVKSEAHCFVNCYITHSRNNVNKLNLFVQIQ